MVSSNIRDPYFLWPSRPFIVILPSRWKSAGRLAIMSGEVARVFASQERGRQGRFSGFGDAESFRRKRQMPRQIIGQNHIIEKDRRNRKKLPSASGKVTEAVRG
jgi:hypothetical protein